MTSQTPAGWYPDPGQIPNGPRTERWWDGARWTDQTRPATTAPSPQPQPQPQPPSQHPAPFAQHPAAPGINPAYPNHPGHPGQLPPKSRGRGRVAIAAGIAVVVLAGIGTGVYALTSGGGGEGKNDKADSRSQSPKETTPGDPDAPGGEGESPAPDAPGATPRAPLDKGFATDVGNGVALPVIKDWTGTDGAGVAGLTVGPYPCPNSKDDVCVKGGASTSSAKRLKLDAKTAKAAAKEDIAKNAKSSYGGKTYQGITGHKQLFAKAVTVAGQQGYRVRWSVETKSGVDAWVESAAFPSPANPDKLVVLRAGIDVPHTAADKAKGPDAGAIDKILKGIKKASVTGDGDAGENV
ncbi:DUF2510 domain-containing protein [Streptomyces endophyticus]|uniref:DUF2510 domain-containing protein n=1 Tax=Streptomyces endophyticus TaxID=714166 RepID=A0ABU6F6X4_9ACTN|nr:DUF2510 domain-containing protein [Streptomyces endophyticus]MEB8339755.1 DUF2510 domain-containing protein [Streptomyces endophyticus]